MKPANDDRDTLDRLKTELVDGGPPLESDTPAAIGPPGCVDCGAPTLWPATHCDTCAAELAREGEASEDIEIVAPPAAPVTAADLDREADRVAVESLAERLYVALIHACGGPPTDRYKALAGRAFAAAEAFVAERDRRRGGS